MDSYASVLESYLIPAEEGFGLDLLKLAGKGVAKVAKAIGIFIGVQIAIVGTHVLRNKISANKLKKRYENPTTEEKLSRENYNRSWLPAINEFKKMVDDDIDKANKKLDIKKFLYTSEPKTHYSKSVYLFWNMYNHYLCGLAWEKCQYPGADGDDEGNPELVKEFSEKISQMKPYFEKWKTAAKKFAPYFELVIEVEDPDKDYYFCNFDLALICKWVDEDGILKPNFPEFVK